MSKRQWVGRGAASVGLCPLYKICLCLDIMGHYKSILNDMIKIYILKGLYQMLCLKQILERHVWKQGYFREGTEKGLYYSMCNSGSSEK